MPKQTETHEAETRPDWVKDERREFHLSVRVGDVHLINPADCLMLVDVVQDAVDAWQAKYGHDDCGTSVSSQVVTTVSNEVNPRVIGIDVDEDGED
jgi:hypothetical protein